MRLREPLHDVSKIMTPDILRNLREAHRLSQLELACILDVSQQAVSKWEIGDSLPTTKALQALSDYYGVPTDCILGRETALQARMRELLARLTPEQAAQLCEIALGMINGAEK